MKKTLIGAGLVIVIALIVFFSLKGGQDKGTLVTVQPAKKKTISSIVKASGEITPEKKVEISAKVVGEITELPVKEGDTVHKGEKLVQIERDIYEASRNQAKASLDQAVAAIERAKVQLADAARTLKRTQHLFASGLASQEQLDSAEVAFKTAQVGLIVQRHTVAQFKSALKRAQDDLARTAIMSPMNGEIIQLNAQQGETVVPGRSNLPGSVIMTIADMSRILAEVNVGEVDIVHVKLGQHADIHVDALGDKTLTGRVVEIATSGVLDTSEGTIKFKVKIAIDHPDPRLRPAMTAKADILTATHKNVVVVPIQAVVKRAVDHNGHEIKGKQLQPNQKKRNVVYLFRNGKARLSPVKTGISNELLVEIVQGVKPGDRVITGPYRTLKSLHDGDAIYVTGTPDGQTTDAGEDKGNIRVRVR
ncbi:MAG: efflux RND transporter periplasmic adaptor subunit [Acidobacteria bacterium]|nr:efflux RND transporter periplasmic adaptor subunit [Acidobacteriota bacterium]